MAHQLEPLPLPHGVSRYLPTNSDAKEKQVELAQVRDFCQQAGPFSGSNKEDVRDFLHGVDIAARENGMSSFRVAKVLFHQLLRGKAKTFAQTALSMPYRYPNANYYCEQIRVQGRKHVRYQPPITNRIPSASSTDGEARTHSSGEDVDSADSISSVATVASIPGDEAAQPQVLHVPHVDRVHRIHRTHHTSRKHRRAEPIPPVHPRRRHISPRMEVPELPEIKEAIEVQEEECLRHYLYEAFFKPEDPEIAHTAFLQSLHQDRSTSVRSWIWDMQQKQAIWHQKFHGRQGYQNMVQNNQPFVRQAEQEIISAIKRNSVDEFKQFYQQLEASNPNCMKTIDQCHKIAFTFENNYEPGIRFTNKTTSETKRYAMSADLVGTYDDSPPPPPISEQYTQHLPPTPAGLTPQQWQLALSAMGSFNNSQQNLHPPNDHQAPMENSAAAASRGNRGGSNRGNSSNRGGRGGGAGQNQSGSNQSSNSQRQKPQPNPIHKAGRETWEPPQKTMDTWTGTKPDPGQAVCYYCALPSHCTSECNRRRQDLSEGMDRPFHPDRGHLRGGRYNLRRAQRMVKQGKAQTTAQALTQVQQAEQARINKAKAQAHQSTSAATTTTTNHPNASSTGRGTPYAQLDFQHPQQFPTSQAPSYNQGSYQAHYSTAPANAATTVAPPQPVYMPPPVPTVPQPGPQPILYLPPAPTIPDLRNVRPTTWADEVHAEATAEEMRRANQINNHLMS